MNGTAVRVAGSAAVTLDGCTISSPPPDDKSLNELGLPQAYSQIRSAASLSLGRTGIVRLHNTVFEKCQVQFSCMCLVAI